MNRLAVDRMFAVVGVAFATLFLGACGGGGGGGAGAKSQVTGVQTVDGTAAVYNPGPLPAPHGAVTASVPAAGDVINGGSTQVTITASGNIIKVYVGVMGRNGYYELPVPPGSSIADILLTLAQLLPQELTIVFEVEDVAGDVSSPTMLHARVTTVGTGDIQVSVSWDVANDIDLHVVDPGGFEIYYGDDTSPEGGMLDLDSNAGCAVDGVDNENVRWPTGKAPHGTYVVRVDNYAACTEAAVHYVVTVQKVGQVPQTFPGSFLATDPGDSGDVGAGTAVATFVFP